MIPVGAKPRDYLVEGTFGHHSVRWAHLSEPTPLEVAALAGAYHQHRLAVAVRQALRALDLEEGAFAELLGNGGDRRAAVRSLAARLDGTAWLDLSDEGAWRLLLDLPPSAALPDGGVELLPTSCAHLLKDWKPGRLTLPGAHPSSDDAQWRLVVMRVLDDLYARTIDGRGHLLDAPSIRDVVLDILSSVAKLRADALLIGQVGRSSAIFQVDHPQRQNVTVVFCDKSQGGDFDAQDERVADMVAGLYGHPPARGTREVVLMFARRAIWERAVRLVPGIEPSEQSTSEFDLTPQDVRPLFEQREVFRGGPGAALSSTLKLGILCHVLHGEEFCGSAWEILKESP